jgi:hypothetical protein
LAPGGLGFNPIPPAPASPPPPRPPSAPTPSFRRGCPAFNRVLAGGAGPGRFLSALAGAPGCALALRTRPVWLGLFAANPLGLTRMAGVRAGLPSTWLPAPPHHPCPVGASLPPLPCPCSRAGRPRATKTRRLKMKTETENQDQGQSRKNTPKSNSQGPRSLPSPARHRELPPYFHRFCFPARWKAVSSSEMMA